MNTNIFVLFLVGCAGLVILMYGILLIISKLTWKACYDASIEEWGMAVLDGRVKQASADKAIARLLAEEAARRWWQL